MCIIKNTQEVSLSNGFVQIHEAANPRAIFVIATNNKDEKAKTATADQ
jgi:hypothetical protein